jgi:hypothetical protein
MSILLHPHRSVHDVDPPRAEHPVPRDAFSPCRRHGLPHGLHRHPPLRDVTPDRFSRSGRGSSRGSCDGGQGARGRGDGASQEGGPCPPTCILSYHDPTCSAFQPHGQAASRWHGAGGNCATCLRGLRAAEHDAPFFVDTAAAQRRSVQTSNAKPSVKLCPPHPCPPYRIGRGKVWWCFPSRKHGDDRNVRTLPWGEVERVVGRL